MSDDDLEPIALAHIEDGEVVGISRDNGDSWTTQSISSLSCDPEPLFTPEQFFELMERHRERACYCDGGDGVNEPECHFCAFVRNVREEFTQLSEAE